MYLVPSTWPDLNFKISFLAQFSSAPNKQHMAAIKCCLQYFKGTRYLTLLFPSGGMMVIAGFSDSDYGNCIDSRQSVSGYLFKLRNSTISWRSQKYKSVYTSIIDAEYIAFLKATKLFLWLKTTLKTFNF
jgi:hypothetical protein